MGNEANQSIVSEAIVKRWAWIRIVLGWLQMAGAAASITMLAVTGASTTTVVIVSVTAVFLVISLILFRVLRMPTGRRSA